MSTQPTDAELKDMWQLHAADIGGIFCYARAVLVKWGTPQPSPVEPPAPRGEAVAWLNPWRADQVTTDYDAYGRRGIPLYTAPQPTTAQAASSAVLKAIREANMQLVRTGDDAFMLVPYKAVTAKAAKQQEQLI